MRGWQLVVLGVAMELAYWVYCLVGDLPFPEDAVLGAGVVSIALFAVGWAIAGTSGVRLGPRVASILAVALVFVVLINGWRPLILRQSLGSHVSLLSVFWVLGLLGGVLVGYGRGDHLQEAVEE